MPDTVSQEPAIDRRTLLAGAAGGALVGLPSVAVGQVLGMRDRAQRWIETLDAPQRDAALFDFTDNLRGRWSFMHGARPAPGLPLEEMRAAQKDLALDLVSSGLSAEGMETALNIMLQQDILRDEWNKGSPDRNRERFSLLIFGAPSATDPWGWRFEGHHLSLSYTLVGDQVVSVTPSSFSSEPNTVPSGPHQGLVVLPVEEMGRALFADLSDAHRRAAMIQRDSFGNILTTAGNLGRVGAPEGVPIGDLPQGQIDRVVRLVEIYTQDHLPTALAQDQQSRLREGDLMSARFGWAGPNEAEQSMYYRLHGPTFLIEFATLPRQPQHHHAVRHDFERNMGAHAI
ncbi:MAG: DUF3500 domain-containing protein [Pseudomonadota bacterium]